MSKFWAAKEFNKLAEPLIKKKSVDYRDPDEPGPLYYEGCYEEEVVEEEVTLTLEEFEALELAVETGESDGTEIESVVNDDGTVTVVKKTTVVSTELKLVEAEVVEEEDEIYEHGVMLKLQTLTLLLIISLGY